MDLDLLSIVSPVLLNELRTEVGFGTYRGLYRVLAGTCEGTYYKFSPGLKWVQEKP